METSIASRGRQADEDERVRNSKCDICPATSQREKETIRNNIISTWVKESIPSLLLITYLNSRTRLSGESTTCGQKVGGNPPNSGRGQDHLAPVAWILGSSRSFGRVEILGTSEGTECNGCIPNKTTNY